MKEIKNLTKGEIKQVIADYVSRYYTEFHQQQEFIPGVTPIPYAGRVYDEKELINLVDSSLDFWLTLGHGLNGLRKPWQNTSG